MSANASHPKILVLVGLPGSGKSTWIAGHNLPSLSSDDIRQLLIDDATNQSIQRRVFALLRHLLKLRLALRRPVTCVDATNLSLRERRPYLALGQLYDAAVEAVFFDVPLEICKQRNRARNRTVPDHVIDQMAARLVPPTTAEGFSCIEVVRS